MKKIGLILSLFLLLCLGVNADAATRWVVHTGGLTSGTCTTTGTACTFAYAQSIAVAGDEVVLRDGTYANFGPIAITTGGTSNTNRITYRAENRRMAVLQPGSSVLTFRIRRSWITLRGFRIDGGVNNAENCWQVFDTDTSVVTGVIIEDIYCHDMGSAATRGAQNVTNLIYRYNDIQNVAKNAAECCGEIFYIGKAGGGVITSGVEIYGNYATGTLTQFMDQKTDSFNVNAHHNIIEAIAVPVVGNDFGVGLLTASDPYNSAANNKFENNIIRSSPAYTGTIFFPERQQEINNNVIYDLANATTAFRVEGSAATPMDLTNNTWRNTPSTITQTPSGSATTTGNTFGASQPAVDAEVDRIMNELAPRPVLAAGSCVIADAAPTLIDCSPTNSVFPGYTTLDITKFTCGATPSRVCVNGAPATINSVAALGSNGFRITLASAVVGGNTVELDGLAGAFINTGLVGNALISDRASNAAFADFAVTNNVGGAPAHEFLQTHFALYELFNTPAGAPVLLTNAIDQNAFVAPKATIRIRLKVKAKAATPPPFNARVRYSKNVGSFTELTSSFANGIRAYGTTVVDSRIPTHNAPTSEILTSDESTNVSCVYVRDAVSIPNLVMSEDSETECEWIVQFDDTVVNADAFRFRVYDDQGAVIHNSGTAIVEPTVTIRSYRRSAS